MAVFSLVKCTVNVEAETPRKPGRRRGLSQSGTAIGKLRIFPSQRKTKFPLNMSQKLSSKI